MNFGSGFHDEKFPKWSACSGCFRTRARVYPRTNLIFFRASLSFGGFTSTLDVSTLTFFFRLTERTNRYHIPRIQNQTLLSIPQPAFRITLVPFPDVPPQKPHRLFVIGLLRSVFGRRPLQTGQSFPTLFPLLRHCIQRLPPLIFAPHSVHLEDDFVFVHNFLSVADWQRATSSTRCSPSRIVCC